MIPSLLDRQIRQGVADFVRTTFTITIPTFAQAEDRLCDTPGRTFKSSNVSLGRFHDTPHISTTSLFENGTPEQVVRP